MKKLIVLSIIVFSFFMSKGQSFESLSSDFDDFSLVFIQDSVLLFSSEKGYNASKWNFDNNCHFSSIWASNLKNKGTSDEHWTNPKRILIDEQYADLSIAGKSTNPNYIILYNGSIGNGDLFIGHYKNGHIGKLMRIEFPSSRESQETFGFWDEENSKFYVCSNRENEESHGGFDIWMMSIEDFKCSDIKNLGFNINSEKDEMSVSMKNDTLYFNSNKDSDLNIYYSSKKRFIWNKPILVEDVNSTFDEHSFDPHSNMWCSNKNNGVYNMFDYEPPKFTKKEVVPKIIFQKKLEEKTIKKPTGDTIAIIYDGDIDRFKTVFDSIGFKMDYAYVQIGAYHYLHSETRLRSFYPNIMDEIKTEVSYKNGKKLTKFMIDIKYIDLREAFKKQKQCFSSYFLLDPFIAVYSDKDERIVIFFKENHYIVLKKY